jgi:hypothetical protein
VQVESAPTARLTGIEARCTSGLAWVDEALAASKPFVASLQVPRLRGPAEWAGWVGAGFPRSPFSGRLVIDFWHSLWYHSVTDGTRKPLQPSSHARISRGGTVDRQPTAMLEAALAYGRLLSIHTIPRSRLTLVSDLPPSNVSSARFSHPSTICYRSYCEPRSQIRLWQGKHIDSIRRTLVGTLCVG